VHGWMHLRPKLLVHVCGRLAHEQPNGAGAGRWTMATQPNEGRAAVLAGGGCASRGRAIQRAIQRAAKARGLVGRWAGRVPQTGLGQLPATRTSVPQQ